MLVLDREDVRKVLDRDALRQALAAGYVALSDGRGDVPVRTMTRTESGLLGTMPGYVAGIGLAAKLVSVFEDNARVGLPTHMAVVVLFDDDTGVPLALCDGEVITEMRTAGSAALACDLLAPADVSVLTVIGAGVQAAGHLEAFAALRPWSEIRLTNRTPERAHQLARRHPEVQVVEDIDRAVHGADVVVCTTASPEPVFDPSSFTGRHVSSVGLHRELPGELVSSGRVVVQTRAATTTPPPNGPAVVQGLEDVVELGRVVRDGLPPGDAHTVWVSVGNAMEDVVTARLAYDTALASGVGRTLDL
ncbi:MAG: ornithine cyclodeaminase family protein [Acidimicrobiia bacterium]